MDIIETKIKDLLVIKPKIFEDDRGYFFESYDKVTFTKLGIDYEFVQDNQSKSQKNVLRGMHFQKPPYQQGKLVRVVKGSVLDVAVDLRPDSLTYGIWESVVLSESNHLLLWVPPGFAHGFLSLEDDTIFTYKCTGYYNRYAEGSFVWNDPKIGIVWGIDNPILSEKDKNATLFDWRR